MELKPVPVEYRGYLFRSRLEARWAVFFESLGIAWEYEKEAYDLGELGRYLPDFYLPQERMWAEVKADLFDRRQVQRCMALVDGTDRPCLLLSFTPRNGAYGALVPSSALTSPPPEGQIWPYARMKCYCLSEWPGPLLEVSHCVCGNYPLSCPDGCAGCRRADVQRAVDAARNARFERR